MRRALSASSKVILLLAGVTGCSVLSCPLTSAADGWTLAGSSGFLTQALGDFGLLPEEPAADRFIDWVQSVAMGFELTERNTMYAEWYGHFSHALADEFTISIFNVGIDHYITDDLVVDIRVGVGLNDESDNLFAGVGGGYRF